MSRRPRSPPETATYARFQRKGRPDLYLRLRRSWLPGGSTADAPHIDGRTPWDHLFAAAVLLRPLDCAARVRPVEHPGIQRAKAVATRGSLVARTFHPQAPPRCRAPAIPSVREARWFRRPETRAPLGPEKSPKWFAARGTRFGHQDPQNPSPVAGPVPGPRCSCRKPCIPQETLRALPWRSTARNGEVFTPGPRPSAPIDFLFSSALLEADFTTERAQDHFRCRLADCTKEGTSRLEGKPGVLGLQREVVLDPA